MSSLKSWPALSSLAGGDSVRRISCRPLRSNYLPIYRSKYLLGIYLCIHRLICLSAYQPISLSAYLPTYSTYLYTYRSFYVTIRPSTYQHI